MYMLLRETPNLEVVLIVGMTGAITDTHVENKAVVLVDRSLHCAYHHVVNF